MKALFDLIALAFRALDALASVLRFLSRRK